MLDIKFIVMLFPKAVAMMDVAQHGVRFQLLNIRGVKVTSVMGKAAHHARKMLLMRLEQSRSMTYQIAPVLPMCKHGARAAVNFTDFITL